MAITHFNLILPAPTAKNWRILLEQSSTACMLLLTAITAYTLEARVLLDGVTYILIPISIRLFSIVYHLSTTFSYHRGTYMLMGPSIGGIKQEYGNMMTSYKTRSYHPLCKIQS